MTSSEPKQFFSESCDPSAVGIAAIAYALPERQSTVEALSAAGRLVSPAAALRDFGFSICGETSRSAGDLAGVALRDALACADLAPEAVDLLIGAVALPPNCLVPDGDADAFSASANPLRFFKYTTSKLQHDLGLVNARTLAVTELSCVALLQAVWLGEALMQRDNLDAALCFNADVFPRGASREVVYNVVSDAACAVLLRRGHPRLRLRRCRQISKGFYWDCEQRQGELVSAYFVTAKRLILQTVEQAGLTLDDIAWIVPHNVSLRSWEILARLIGFPIERIFTRNISTRAHSIASDNFMNLKDLADSQRVQAGEHVLLFSFGLGAHWACGIVTA